MPTVVGVIVAISTILVVVRLLWKGQLREKYVVLWIVVSFAMIVLASWPGLISAMARLAGFELGSNLLFFVAILFLFSVCLHLSLEVSTLESETRRLAEEVAILRHAHEQGSSRLVSRNPQE